MYQLKKEDRDQMDLLSRHVIKFERGATAPTDSKSSIKVDLLLRSEVLLQLLGYEKNRAISICKFLEGLANGGCPTGSDFTESMRRSLGGVPGILKELCFAYSGLEAEERADQALTGSAATRLGVTQDEIAYTLTQTSDYLLALNVGPNVNRVAEELTASGGIVELIKRADQVQLREIFNQGLGRALASNFDRLIGLLKFQATRDEVHSLVVTGSEALSKARALLDRIERFRPTWGHELLSVCIDLDSEINSFQRSSRRFPGEVFVEPEDYECKLRPCYYREVDLAESLELWQNAPRGGFIARFKAPLHHPLNPFVDLASRKEDLRKTFGNDAEIAVRLGQTIGGDHVEVRLSEAHLAFVKDEMANCFRRNAPVPTR